MRNGSEVFQKPRRDIEPHKLGEGFLQEVISNLNYE